MSKIDPQNVAQYQDMLAKDPKSKIFATLAESYRFLKMYGQAEKVLKNGLQHHPNYASAWLVLGNLMIDLEKFSEAEKALKRAIELAPENLLARELLGRTYLSLNQPKEALKAYKMALFFSPQNEKAKKAVQKLESLTAEDYESDLFEMKPLKLDQTSEVDSTKLNILTSDNINPVAFDRELSFLDALIARNEIAKAKDLLALLHKKFPENPALSQRWKVIDYTPAAEEIEDLSPLHSREREVLGRKIQLLESLLQRIKAASSPRF